MSSRSRSDSIRVYLASIVKLLILTASLYVLIVAGHSFARERLLPLLLHVAPAVVRVGRLDPLDTPWLLRDTHLMIVRVLHEVLSHLVRIDFDGGLVEERLRVLIRRRTLVNLESFRLRPREQRLSRLEVPNSLSVPCIRSVFTAPPRVLLERNRFLIEIVRQLLFEDVLPRSGSVHA